MEWIWVAILVAPIAIPVVWAVTRGRRVGRPADESATEAASMVQVMKDTMDANNSFGPRG